MTSFHGLEVQDLLDKLRRHIDRQNCPENSYKTYRGGTRRIQEHFRKVTRTYKYRYAKTLRSNRFKSILRSLQNKSRQTGRKRDWFY